MRPIHLRVCGLHSYRDPVEVDFEGLGRFGLFGIFGPTGAGKSSLLDAMTLALYGQIDRHPGRSRRGVINPQCDRLEVDFRFSLSGGEQAGVYEVRRVYRADKEGSAQSHSAALCRLQPETPEAPGEVLAEQESRVSERVEALLGLNATDFTRAVVLPQGRFMAFLHLKGKERRTMLQRILRLGAYGDGLREQVKVRLDAVESERSNLEGERTGLGPASPEDIAAAEVELEAARGERKRAELGLRLAERSYAEASDIRAREAALAEAERALREHLAEEALVGRQAMTLAASARAWDVMGPGARWESARTAEADARAEAGRLGARAEALRAGAAAARGALEALRDSSAREAAALASRRESLKVAAGLAERRALLTAELAPLAAALADRDRDLARLQAGLAERRAALEALGAERAQIREARAKEAVPEAERAALDAAVEALAELRRQEVEANRVSEALAGARRRQATLQAERDKASARYDEARAALSAAGGALSQAELNPARRDREKLLEEGRALRPAEQAADEAAAAAKSVAEATAELSQHDAGAKARVDALRAAERAATEADRAYREAEEAAEAARTHAVLAALAARLSPGEPCPLCGGAEHPAPARPGGPGVDAAALAAARSAADRAAREAAEARARWTAGNERARPLRQRLTDAERALAEARGRLPDELRAEADPREAMAERRRVMESTWRASEAAWKQLEACRAATERARLEAERARSPLETAERRLEDADREVARLSSERERRLEGYGHAAEALDRVRGELEIDDIPARAAALAERDQRARESAQRLSALDEQLAALRAQVDTDGAALAALERDTAGDRARRDGLVARIAELGEQIEEVAAASDPAAALAAAEAALDALEAKLTEAAQSLEVKRAAAEGARAEADAARAAQLARESALEGARQELEHALLVAGFEGLADARAAALTPEEQERLDRHVTAWSTRRAQLEEGAQQARRAMRGEQMTDERWLDVVTALDQARVSSDETLERRAAAEHKLVVLRERTARFAALSARLSELDRLQGRLSTLRSLFAGNKFVEFVAQDTLTQIARQASAHLRQLTDGRFSLSVDPDGTFQIRDQHSGGSTRPVTSLSGGETFLTSLSLALALSAQVQLQGRHPIEFFFLDEGFGSLDPETLDQVMGALDALKGSGGGRMIGIISHVEKVKEWLPRYLEISPPGADGAGSQVWLREA
jgi:exonuclease SbcC